MKNTPLVSVIIPSHNAGPYLIEAVNSVLNQTYHALELIVVDDGSDDDSPAMLHTVTDPRLKVIRLEKSGAAKARNVGIETSNGDFIAFLDADDLWDLQKLEKQLEEYRSDDVNMVFTLMQEFLDTGMREISFPGDFYGNPLTGLSPICMLVSKTDFLKTGFFDESISVGEFIDWFERAKLSGLTFSVMQERLAFRRIHPKNMDRLKRTDVKQYVAVVKAALDRKRNQV